MQTLTWSASFFEEEEPADAAGRKKESAAEVSGKKEAESAADSDKGFMVLTVILSLALSIGLFMVLPFFISNIFRRATDSGLLLVIIEGLVRLMIFIAYIVLISRMKDIQRLFMYHGAEHKTCLLYTSEKIINKMKRQPNGIRQEEADKVLKAEGYELVRQKGSHRHYLNKETGELITIKQENPLKKAYVVSILNRIGK